MDYNTFIQYLDKDNIDYNREMLDKLEMYYTFLIEYNSHTNLTNITDRDAVYLKHFYDSITILKYYSFANKQVLDMGSGAGFPAIVLAIFCPSASFTLVESTGKKTTFLEQLTDKLSLTNVKVVNSRAEELAYQLDSHFDFVTARAVASLPILMELSARFLKIGGQLIAYKTDPLIEVNSAKAASQKLKLKLLNPIEYALPIEDSKRSFIIVEKIQTTPKLYPRNYNQIKRNTL